MIVASFNINGVNSRLANLLAWLAARRPDVVCLQEIKCRNRDFPHDALRRAGYEALWNGQGPHHGVAILARGVQPIETRRALPGNPSDREARYLEAAIGGVLVACLYLPNGNPQPGPKFSYKLAWFERLIDHAAALTREKIPALLVGDFNVVPTDADIYALRSYRDNALVQPEPRRGYAELLDQGWTDAIRQLYPDAPMYTFWDYMRNAWPRDAGLRLDHLLVSPALLDCLRDGGVDRDIRAADNASDHAPAWIDLTV